MVERKDKVNPIILNAIREDAESLIRIAQANNAVVTITLQPQQPPAMGNYVMVADVRPARQRSAPASPSFDLDATCEAVLALLTSEINSHVKHHTRSMSASYSEVKRAMETRHRKHLTKVKTLDPAEAMRQLGEAFSKLSRVTFFPPMN